MNLLLLAIFALSFLGCTEQSAQVGQVPPVKHVAPPEKPQIPPTLAEIVDEENTETTSLLMEFDFKNFTYPIRVGGKMLIVKMLRLKTVNGGLRKKRSECHMLQPNMET